MANNMFITNKERSITCEGRKHSTNEEANTKKTAIRPRIVSTKRKKRSGQTSNEGNDRPSHELSLKTKTNTGKATVHQCPTKGRTTREQGADARYLLS